MQPKILMEEENIVTGLFFSGCGNTRHAAKRFVGEVGGESYSIEQPEATEALLCAEEVLLAYPVYYSNLPRIVREFIEANAAAFAGKRVFLLATMGLFSGDGTGCAARLLRRCGAKISGGLHLKMPDCIGDVKLLKKPRDEQRALIEKADAKLAKAAERLKGGKPAREGLGFFAHMAGLFGQRLWFLHKPDARDLVRVDSTQCVGCGLCTKICPTGNLKTIDGKAAQQGNCTLCYRCFSQCPAAAIRILGKTVYMQYRYESLINEK